MGSQRVGHDWANELNWISFNSMCVLRYFSCVQFFKTPCTVARQALLSMGFSRQEYWSGLPCPPPPGDLPDPGIEPGSPALQGDSLLLSYQVSPTVGTLNNLFNSLHFKYYGRQSEWTPGVGDGQGGLACCDSWGRKESDMTERLIWSDLIWTPGLSPHTCTKF